jgi:hypothetical protein
MTPQKTTRNEVDVNERAKNEAAAAVGRRSMRLELIITTGHPRRREWTKTERAH